MAATTVVLTPRQFFEVRDLHPLLWLVLQSLLSEWPIDAPFMVTSIARTKEEDAKLHGSGVHCSGPPWRALDVRTTNLGINFQERAIALQEHVNRRWVYDPARPKMQVANFAPHGSGPHGHLQVHSATQAREEIV
jgi:hypothetical protein